MSNDNQINIDVEIELLLWIIYTIDTCRVCMSD